MTNNDDKVVQKQQQVIFNNGVHNHNNNKIHHPFSKNHHDYYSFYYKRQQTLGLPQPSQQQEQDQDQPKDAPFDFNMNNSSSSSSSTYYLYLKGDEIHELFQKQSARTPSCMNQKQNNNNNNNTHNISSTNENDNNNNNHHHHAKMSKEEKMIQQKCCDDEKDHHHHDYVYHHNQYVWVSKSKGRKQKKNRNKKGNNNNNNSNNKMIIQIQQQQQQQQQHENNDDKTTLNRSNHYNEIIKEDHGDSTCDDMNDDKSYCRQELFLRATIDLEDNDHDNKNETIMQKKKKNNNKNQNDRIRVRYAGGSTYQVQTKYIQPIYDPRDPYYGYYDRKNDYVNQQQHENVHDNDPILFSSNLHCSQHHPGCYVVPASAIVVVMVHSETDLYHKCCKIHTIPNFDHFIEIGCAEGELIQKMQQCLLLSSSTTTHGYNTIHNENHVNDQPYLILGIDKSISSIEKAKQRYSQCQFELCDIFIDPLPNRLRTLLQQEKQKQQERSQQQQYQLIQEEKDTRNRVETDSGCDQMVVPAVRDHFSSSSSSSSTFSTKTTGIVVAMDINGNRELLAVNQCLQLIMDQIQPRLIIVKSRELYQQLQSFS